MDIVSICQVLEEGGLVISPTDTVYGIMGDALNDEVIKRVFEVKKRPYSKPLILLMSSIEMVEEYVSKISKYEKMLMRKFWPGLVTIILKKNEKISGLITNNEDYVGIRVPNNEDLLKIIEKLGRPVISTSANITGTEVITDISMLEENLIEKIDYIEDGGEIKSVSSTIVKIDGDKLNILRDGKMSNEIRNYFEEIL